MENKIQIPKINRDGNLLSRLIPAILVGADGKFDRESGLYLRLFVRLVDKSFSEYVNAREYLQEEIKTKDKLTYRFTIINHLENCLNALNRVTKIFDVVLNGLTYYEEIDGEKVKRIYKNNINILNFTNKKTIENIKKYRVSNVRNRIEHIDEDIYENKFQKNLFLDVDKKYENICINNKCISFIELAKIIEDYHKFILEIMKNKS